MSRGVPPTLTFPDGNYLLPKEVIATDFEIVVVSKKIISDVEARELFKMYERYIQHSLFVTDVLNWKLLCGLLHILTCI